MKKLLCSLLALTLSFGVITPNVVQAESEKIETKANNLPFTDVHTNDWYYNSVKEAYELGLMKNDGDINTFNPNGSLTRGMVATVLCRMDGTNDKVSFTNKFNDVKEGIWYSDAIIWASKHNIVSGYKNGNFGPDDKITRQDLCIMLYNYATYKNLDTSKKADLSKYKDQKSVASYASNAVSWAVGNGIIGGSSELNPTGYATRAEASKMFVLTSKVKVGTPSTPSEPITSNAVLGIDLMKNVIKEKEITEVYFQANTPTTYDSKYNLGQYYSDEVLGYVKGNVLYITTKDKGNKVIAPKNCSVMFYYCTSLKIIDLSNFDTSNVTDMSWMFDCCYNLTSLDLSNFDTSNVTDMSICLIIVNH